MGHSAEYQRKSRFLSGPEDRLIDDGTEVGQDH
jgi:hypothetical protein